jgi:protein-S-isoprenylcysteine O-methyltransferase Ste14
MTAKSDRTGIVVPPPLLFMGPFALGWLVDRRVRWPLLSDRSISIAFGVFLVVGGAAVAFTGIRRFWRARTTVLPFGGTTQLVTTGIYRFTRNPMYLGMALAYVGCAMLVNSVWCVLFLPVALTLAYVLAIRPEERYLTGKFGEAYRRYCADVRRWI